MYQLYESDYTGDYSSLYDVDIVFLDEIETDEDEVDEDFEFEISSPKTLKFPGSDDIASA